MPRLSPKSSRKSSKGLKRVVKYLNTEGCRDKLPQMFALAHKKFKGDLMYDIDERTLRRHHSAHALVAAAYDEQKQELLSYFAWTVSDTAFRDGLLSGRYDENDLYPYDGTHPPILVFDSFIITSHIHAPFIIRHLTRDLRRLIQLDDLHIVGGLSVGGLRFTEKWLKKYGFYEIGKYKKRYPILWARREESAMLHSLCTVPQI